MCLCSSLCENVDQLLLRVTTPAVSRCFLGHLQEFGLTFVSLENGSKLVVIVCMCPRMSLRENVDQLLLQVLGCVVNVAVGARRTVAVCFVHDKTVQQCLY